jgi:Condensation domain
MKTENIEDIYELSPIQKGILFHSLFAPEFGLYFFQMPFVLRGHLNLEAFESAWQQVIARHTILRTGFYWEDINKPLQVVYREIQIPLKEYDWRGIDPIEQQEKLKSFLESDRKRGFDMSQECLMRLSLFRLADDFYQFVWSRHFIILDGWSVPIVLKEVIQIYEELCHGKEVSLVPSIPYRNYINWLQQDISEAKTFWCQALSGLKAPTSLKNLDVENLSNQEEIYEERRIILSTTTTTALHSLARQHQLTLSTLFQGAWAILLSRYSCEKKVLYGCTVAGRPIELLTDNPLVGLFVNSLPVWVSVDAEEPLLVWLKQLQIQLVEMRQYEWTPLVDIQGWSEVPHSLPLFESILVYENAPVDKILQEWQGSFEVSNSSIVSDSATLYKTNYPLTIAVYPSSEDFAIAINYDFCRFDVATINRILADFQTLLKSMVGNPQACLQDLSLLTERQKRLSSMLEKEIIFNFDLALSN